ncbi:hypothetical protein AL036_05630 [Salipiger aestuarii]|uniref:Antifreeze protein n=1 Tax=Salipiger aestuarii TaxID=568098 RepID=A0A327YGP9_9RHOB|nr:hypothetical protein [Salipiger aestuarii]EIE50824.1 hypothetical protein C357_11794 [Citreicella sp. 357]KAA8608891.1 hypothetical protein AL036_05630 [Salipiger aestuarii]KAA8613195.1 hypothetical protein AL037_05595 [Salipiger aestuarii]KAB2543053.1 hypothetical protein AL035_04160 [Salipiger aestuarii]RAK19681.1 hypothetical protein ATI53_100863 [Salipiger aestuarii]
MYGPLFSTALLWQKWAFGAAQMMMASSSVIQIRVLQMSLGTMRPEEATRMVFEKSSALAKATEMAGRALAANKGPAEASLAGLAPYTRATRANAKRLSRRSSRPK